MVLRMLCTPSFLSQVNCYQYPLERVKHKQHLTEWLTQLAVKTIG